VIGESPACGLADALVAIVSLIEFFKEWTWSGHRVV